MIQYKINRLFNPKSSRLLDVAVDHGFFGEPAFLNGIADMTSAIDTLVAAAPDAIQLTIGQARLLQSRPGRFKPSLVLRSDVANVYGSQLPAGSSAFRSRTQRRPRRSWTRPAWWSTSSTFPDSLNSRSSASETSSRCGPNAPSSRYR